MLAGDKPAICITEPDAGSDTTAISTRADKRGHAYALNGRKHWITGAGISRLHLIFARVFDERGVELGIGGFIAVAGEAKGLRVVRREATMGLRGMPEGEIVFEDLGVPAAKVLAPQSGSSAALPDLMNAYNSQRVGAGIVAMGIAAGALDLAVAWSKSRERSDGPSRNSGPAMAARRNADTAHGIAADAACRRMLARRSREPVPDPMLAAQAKIFASEAAIRIVNEALQMFGARGYSRDLPLERMARDVRMFTIGGGTARSCARWSLQDARTGSCRRPADGYAKAGSGAPRRQSDRAASQSDIL